MAECGEAAWLATASAAVARRASRRQVRRHAAGWSMRASLFVCDGQGCLLCGRESQTTIDEVAEVYMLEHGQSPPFLP